jgi:creatinine amidohydrolase/Fe(II)-dependent formamide hydrolase-like protein
MSIVKGIDQGIRLRPMTKLAFIQRHLGNKKLNQLAREYEDELSQKQIEYDISTTCYVILFLLVGYAAGWLTHL